MTLPVTTIDQLGAAIRTGGGCTTLNVNAGSKVHTNYATTISMHDICMFGGQPYAVHCEIDTSIVMPWDAGTFQRRGPYVHAYDGVSWTLVGSNLDPATDTAPAANGDRCCAYKPRIATDGTDLYVAYYDKVVTDISTGAAAVHIRIAHFGGVGWTEVASEAIPTGWGAFGGSLIGLTVAGGVAYCCYQAASSQRVRVFTSTGSGMFVPGSGTTNGLVGYSDGGQTDGAATAVTTADGRPVGFYIKSVPHTAVQFVTMFDMRTGAELRATPAPFGPSPLTPYQDSDNATPLVQLAAIGLPYDDGKVVVSSSFGALIANDDGSSDITTIDGTSSHAWVGGDQVGIALDPADVNKRQLWAGCAVAVDHIRAAGGMLRGWQPACTGNQMSVTPLNTGPPYAEYATTAAIPADAGGACILDSPNDTIYGPVRLACDGSNVYAFWLSSPAIAGDGTLKYQAQFVVTQFPIQRGASPCPPYQTPVFKSRHKIAN